MDTRKPSQQNHTRNRDAESRKDRTDLARDDATPLLPDEPGEQDESGRTAGPQDPTGLTPKPNHHQKADRADTCEE